MIHKNLRTKLFAAIVFTLSLPAACINDARAQTAGGATGLWLDQAGRAEILIAPCGSGQLCGSIEWLREPLDASGQSKTDIHNSDASLRARRICGMPMLGNFSASGAGAWSGGWIYDAESGKTYKSVMHLAADGTLHVRGYIGVPMFGRSETWTRPSSPLPSCTSG